MIRPEPGGAQERHADAPLVLVAAGEDVVSAVLAGLEPHGYRVAGAAPGDALAACRRLLPTVVLVDTDEAGNDASALLAGLRADADLDTTPVVAVSAHRGAARVAAALEAGVHDLLRSPVEPDELLARVAAAVRFRTTDEAVRQREAELALLSRTDLLTGLANRRHVEEHLRMLAASARRQRQPLSALMVDVDHLRRINERHGHLVGDEVLRAVAVRCAGVLREEDLAGRWGGDKLLVLLPATDLDGAWRSGERIRTAVNDHPVAVDGGNEVVVTVSVGCATGAGDDAEDQVRRADVALAAATAAGRNRVVADTSEAA